MSVSDVVQIAQLSDTHFLEDGAEPEGGTAYDTAQAFSAVHTAIEEQARHDLIVVTGDIADHGRSAQYRRAAEALAGFSAPVNVCPGNHDQDAAFGVGIGRPGVGTSRVLEAGSWCLLFVDSNSGVMVPDETGRRVDPADYQHRLHSSGSLGEGEAEWVRDMCATTAADHVFIWLHHPPLPPGRIGEHDAYASEWRSVLGDTANVRGLGGGHTHVPCDYTFEGRPVFVSPALKHNFDLTANTWLPPGFRTYQLGPDGSIESHLHLMDDARWPRRPLGRALSAMLNGELSSAEFAAIVARKQAEREQQSR